MSYGILFLRVVVGLIFLGHGTQKLFGWWGGPGLGGTRGWLGSIGFRQPARMAVLVALAESSGIVFAFGFLTPFVAVALCSAMVVAIGSVHWRHGFWNTEQGFEFNLTLLAVPIAVAATGPGRFSVDRLLGWDDNLSGPIWGLGVLTVAVVAALVVLTAMRAPEPHAGV
jgi:putative oxidoreductase